MPTLVKGLDGSFAEFTPADAVALYNQGYRVYFGDGWTGGMQSQAGLHAVAEQDLRVFRQTGFYVGEYVNASPADWWPQSTGIYYMKLNAGAEWPNVREVAIDWEIDNTPWERVLELGDLIRAEGKLCRIIYTRKNIVDAAGPCPDVAKALTYKLWLAHYDGIPGLTVPIPAPWWTGAVLGKQWGGGTINGKDYDEDTFDADFFGQSVPAGTTPTGGEQMTPEQAKMLQDIHDWLFTPQSWGDNAAGGWYGRTTSRAEMFEVIARYLDNGQGALFQVVHAAALVGIDPAVIAKAVNNETAKRLATAS